MKIFFLKKWILGSVMLPGLLMVSSCSDKDQPDINPEDKPVEENPILPVAVLNFEFPDYPDKDQIWLKEEYIQALLSVKTGDNDATEPMELTVKGRGNSTWGMAKKPMRLKFKKKTELLGLKNAKNFVLLADYIDPSHMRNVVAFWLGTKLGVPYTNEIEPCNLYINGYFAGLYHLTNKVGINSGSVDIDEESGVLFEISTEYDEPYKFRSAIYNLPVMVKDPDLEEVTSDPENMLQTWSEDFNKAEKLASQGKAWEAFDLESAVNYILVQDLCGNDEIGHPKSVYLFKENLSADSKYIFGPLWDFDAALNRCDATGTKWYKEPEKSLWVNKLFNRFMMTSEFKQLYAKRFEQFYTEIYPELLDFIDTYSERIQESSENDGLRWNLTEPIGDWAYRVPSTDADQHVADLKDWIVRRVEWCRNKLNK